MALSIISTLNANGAPGDAPPGVQPEHPQGAAGGSAKLDIDTIRALFVEYDRISHNRFDAIWQALVGINSAAGERFNSAQRDFRDNQHELRMDLMCIEDRVSQNQSRLIEIEGVNPARHFRDIENALARIEEIDIAHQLRGIIDEVVARLEQTNFADRSARIEQLDIADRFTKLNAVLSRIEGRQVPHTVNELGALICRVLYVVLVNFVGIVINYVSGFFRV